MLSLRTKVSGLEAVKLELDGLHGTVRDQLKRATMQAAQRVVSIARANVSGKVLNTRTGKLAGSLDWLMREGETNIHARVGTDWYVGRFWEKGFNGNQTVKSHLRAIKSGSRFQVMKLSKRGKLTKGRLFKTGATEVSGYSRTSDGRARPWLSLALDAIRSDFRSEVLRIAKENSSHGR